jgi:hypothetical protein
LKYEDLVGDLDRILEEISQFLKKEIRATSIPERDRIAGIDGRHVRSQEAARELPDEYLNLL